MTTKRIRSFSRYTTSGYTSPHIKSLVDEECEKRNWVYLSFTGVHQFHFGMPKAQIHCTASIDYLRTQAIDGHGNVGLNIDTDRIYMAGFSMGGGGAGSYTVRHMSAEEGYPVAGLIMVEPTLDLIDAYYQDPVAKTCMLDSEVFGNSPDNIPFQYKQVSMIHLPNGSQSPTWDYRESMGWNIGNQIPVFLTYDLLSNPAYLTDQNQIFELMVTTMPSHKVIADVQSTGVHGWSMLDVHSACSWLNWYSLPDQVYENVHFWFIADRDAKFRWVDVDKDSGVFEEVFAELDMRYWNSSTSSQVRVEMFRQIDAVTVDTEVTGIRAHLLPGYFLTTGFQTQVDPGTQLRFSKVDEPTYMTSGPNKKLYPNYTWDPTTEVLEVDIPSFNDPYFKASYAVYNLSLTGPSPVGLGQNIDVTLDGGDPGDPYLLFISAIQREWPLVKLHTILVPPFGATTVMLWMPPVMTWPEILKIKAPTNPMFQGETFYLQFITYTKSVKEVSNLYSLLIQ